jgi:hypothetical protein
MMEERVESDDEIDLEAMRQQIEVMGRGEEPDSDDEYLLQEDERYEINSELLEERSEYNEPKFIKFKPMQMIFS